MIRAGKEKDMPDIVRMARDFWQHTQFKDEEYQPEMVEGMAKACMDQGLMCVYESAGEVHGFACGIAGPLMANMDVISGTEMAWYVDPEHRGGKAGIGLLKELESMAKAAGCKYWTMIFMQSSMPAQVEGMYKKMGYNLQETSYTKVI